MSLFGTCLCLVDVLVGWGGGSGIGSDGVSDGVGVVSALVVIGSLKDGKGV